MGSSSSRRWDLLVGVLASLIALAGLVVSISLRNTITIGGAIDLQFQETLAVLALLVLLLVVIKAALRYRGHVRQLCRRGLEEWMRARRP
jgi:hypothetical protein